MRRPHVWTPEEIQALPEFGASSGWFYALARVNGKTRFGEVIPGAGIALCSVYPWWSLRQWARAIRDVFCYRPEGR